MCIGFGANAIKTWREMQALESGFNQQEIFNQKVWIFACEIYGYSHAERTDIHM